VRRRLLGAVVLLALFPAPVGADELLVAAAASLRSPCTQIAARFEAEHPETGITLTFGASNLLAAQIAGGAPVDVFLSADVRSVDRLESSGLLLPGSRRAFAGNRLVAVQAEHLPAPIREAQELLGPEVRRIALPDPAVPVGRYAREWLARRGLLRDVEQRAVRTEDARATLAAVDLGHVDAAIVYATDAVLARAARVAFTIAPEEQPPIAYVGAATRRAAEPDTARSFLDFLVGPGAAVLQEAGFSEPPGSARPPSR
jgi:molybdate transport system substrate-binding protein